MVVEGESARRLAIECDGDLYHGPERWADDMRRQRILERVGWAFWRCFGSNYSLDREAVLDDLFHTLDRMDIKPVGGTISGSRYTEHRVVRVGIGPTSVTGQEDDTRLSAGDEIGIRVGDRERTVLYMNLEREPRQAA